MKAWLFNAYQTRDCGVDRQILSIFLAEHTLDGDALENDLVSELEKLGPIHAIHFVGFPDSVGNLRKLLAQPASLLMDRLYSVVGNSGDSLTFVSIDPATGEHTCNAIQGGTHSGSGLLDIERQHSLLEVFCRAGGEERAPTGTHYSKTSERHSDRFLRVANVLEDSRHVKLLAFWLVPYIWKAKAQHVVVDTSGIYSVALTALSEIMRLGGLPAYPAVWSHRSHEGVNQVTAEVAGKALFLVSASTSNGLVRRLMERGATPSKLITLFSLCQDPCDEHIVLCNLNGLNGDGLEFIENQDSSNCRWCKQHFHVIGIRGDQFSVSPPRVTSVEIVATDLPSSAKSTLSSLTGLGVFYAYRRIDNGRLCSLGADVTPLLSGKPPEKSKALVDKVRSKWAAMTRRSQTISLRRIVAAAYPGSASLSEELLESTQGKLTDHMQVQIVSSSKLRHEAPTPGTSTVVVSACVDEIQELLSISRNLRDIQDGGTTTYLAVLQMLAPKKVAERLKSNLTYGALGADTFSSFSALDLEVHCYEDEPSWATELTVLRRMISWADNKGIDVPVEVELRVQRLTRAVATGLSRDLYWPDMNGNPLGLRSDFALLGGALQTPVATQADLFAAICTLLTRLRGHTDGSKRLANNSYERSVLSPLNFSRFNDGVLQASFLRACRSKELAYGACDEETSRQMLGVLLDALPNATRPEKSEALIEFLLALLTQRMTLQNNDLREFITSVVNSTESTWPVAWLFARFIQDELKAG